MNQESKGDYLDFVEDAIVNKPLHNDLLKLLATDPEITPEELLSYFKELQYYDVSLEDCQKLASIAKQLGNAGVQQVVLAY